MTKNVNNQIKCKIDLNDVVLLVFGCWCLGLVCFYAWQIRNYWQVNNYLYVSTIIVDLIASVIVIALVNSLLCNSKCFYYHLWYCWKLFLYCCLCWVFGCFFLLVLTTAFIIGKLQTFRYITTIN